MTILPLPEQELRLPTESRELPGEPLMVHEYAALDISDDEFSLIRRILLANRGFDIEAYKDRCVRRRIAIRIRSNHCDSAKAYCDILLNHKAETDHLVKVLTIHVSQFFRNFPTFEKLRLEIIPLLFATARQSGKSELRFWSLGCAGGEEPYSLALLLAEHFASEMQEVPVRITATDIDATTLDLAQSGIFGHERMHELPLVYLQRYFTESGIRYQLAQQIMAMVDFRRGDMFDDLIYEKSDLILCRNALIYFSREQQEKIFRNVSRVIDSSGFLVLGKSETILGDSRNLFQTVCPVERIYRPTRTSSGWGVESNH
jgi:chemotaxis protein methyltransferase CheR